LGYPGLDGTLEAGKVVSPYTPVSLRLHKWTTDSGYGDAPCHVASTASTHASAIGPGGHGDGQHNVIELQVHLDLHELRYLAYWLDLI
jgi:hypothetical protein